MEVTAIMASSLLFQKVENDETANLPLSIYQIIGRIDPETSNEFENTLKIFQKQEKNIIFDFSAITYINSFGIGILVDTQKNLVKNGGNVIICGLSPSIKKIFQITYLTRVFDIYDDLNTALQNVILKLKSAKQA